MVAITKSLFPLTLLLCASNIVIAASIEVKVNGLEGSQGKLVVGVHDNEDSFPTRPEKARYIVTSEIKAKTATVRVENVEPGVYAIAAYHDENNNGKLDTNFIGIPSEGVGSTSRSRSHFGPPKFSQSSLHIEQGENTVEITLKY